jgi:hypothetical protein
VVADGQTLVARICGAFAKAEWLTLGGDTTAALEAIRSFRPHLLVLDADLTRSATGAICRAVRRDAPAVAVLLVARSVQPPPAVPADGVFTTELQGLTDEAFLGHVNAALAACAARLRSHGKASREHAAEKSRRSGDAPK